MAVVKNQTSVKNKRLLYFTKTFKLLAKFNKNVEYNSKKEENKKKSVYSKNLNSWRKRSSNWVIQMAIRIKGKKIVQFIEQSFKN